MAKRRKLLLRSAESIGRVIGSLQRELDDARLGLSGLAAEPLASLSRPSRSHRDRTVAARERSVRRRSKIKAR